MISLYTIYALFMRYVQQLVRDPWRLVSVFYWPLIDLTVFGFIGSAKGFDATEAELLLAGSMLWILVSQVYYFVIWNMLEELWSYNIVSLFATSVTLIEWTLSLVAMAGLMLLALYCYINCMSYIIYGFTLFRIGWYLIPIIINLFFFSVSLGSCLNSLLFFGGVRVQSLVFMVGWLFAPFVGVFYPINVLPMWMQMVAQFLPPMHTFLFVRTLLDEERVVWSVMTHATLLNLLWLATAWFLLKRMYHFSRMKGLSRLVD